MASHADIQTTATYAALLQTINERLSDLARGADPSNSTVTNYAVSGIRWSSAASKWQKNTGTQASPVWSDLATTYAISISGNAATATTLQTPQAINGVNFNGSAPITIMANTETELTFDSSGVGAASGSTFNGGTARTISYNTVGAPAANGTGASGTWNISVSGNAATATVADESASTTVHNVYFGAVAAGSAALRSSSTKLQFQPSTGNLTAAGDIRGFSDARLKTDLEEIRDALAKVRSLVGYTYTRKDTKQRQTGLLAQDVLAVLPEAVGRDDKFLSLSYGNLMGLMVQAIKELADRVEALEAR